MKNWAGWFPARVEQTDSRAHLLGAKQREFLRTDAQCFQQKAQPLEDCAVSNLGSVTGELVIVSGSSLEITSQDLRHMSHPATQRRVIQQIHNRSCRIGH